ncbi:hypothetical protein C8R44DRAFT_240169 [Mycena epipterygia]|nr:hypothetical protein C8R44DRAFT_240169 [Mycena epipterygia]
MMKSSVAARTLALLQAFCGSEGGVADRLFTTTVRLHVSSARCEPLVPSFPARITLLANEGCAWPILFLKCYFSKQSGARRGLRTTKTTISFACSVCIPSTPQHASPVHALAATINPLAPASGRVGRGLRNPQYIARGDAYPVVGVRSAQGGRRARDRERVGASSHHASTRGRYRSKSWYGIDICKADEPMARVYTKTGRAPSSATGIGSEQRCGLERERREVAAFRVGGTLTR